MRLLSLSEVSIQKRTSPDKFTEELGIRDFEISFAISHVLAFELAAQVAHPPQVFRGPVAPAADGAEHLRGL